MSLKVITKEELNNRAPSVFGSPVGRAKSYTGINTGKIVDVFENAGWSPVQAYQSSPRKGSKIGLRERKHLLKFAPSNTETAGVILGKKDTSVLVPNLVLTNSHDGTSSVQLQAGIFRVVCSNGLMVCDKDMGMVRLRHSGNPDAIYEAIFQVERTFSDVWSKIDEYQSINLNVGQRLDFAVRAAELRFGHGNSPVAEQQFYKPNRESDEDFSLWNTFNVLQENLMKGGIDYQTRNGKHRKTKAIRNDIRNARFNTMLWAMMENFRSNKSFAI